MYFRFCLVIALLIAAPVWSQVNDSSKTTSNDSTGADDARMLTPPPVSGAAYATTPESQERSNYLRAGVMFNAAYTDNVLGGVTAKPVSDVDYSVWPTIALDQTTSRLHSVLTYAPGFTFYQRTSGRNEADQNFGADVQYRLSPHVTATLRDSFQKTSSVLNQPDALSAAAVFGSPQAPTAAVIAPVADLLSNNASAELTYQFSRMGMIGGSGTFTDLNYPNPAEVPGLYDSNSRGGSAFYSRRLSKKHYIGTQYQYSRILAFPTGPQFETQTHTVLFFYTIYLKPTLSVSFSGGPQHYEAIQNPHVDSRSWSPAANASLGWQGKRTTFAASYSRTVTGGGGLLGAFHSNSASASARWRVTQTWSLGALYSYAIYKNVTPLVVSSYPGGHSISVTASVKRPFGEHFNAEAGYTRIHQSFNGISVVSTTPDTNQEFISIGYQFSRPLGR